MLLIKSHFASLSKSHFAISRQKCDASFYEKYPHTREVNQFIIQHKRELSCQLLWHKKRPTAKAVSRL